MWSKCPSLLLLLVTASVLPGLADSTASCDFEDDDCGYLRNGKNERLQWKRLSWFRNDYMSLKMEDASVNDTRTLISPWLNGSDNHRCRLRFDYYLKEDNVCRLSVSVRTYNSKTVLWSTPNEADWLTSQTLTFNCTEPRFQIAFEGKKISSGYLFGRKELAVDNISFEIKLTPLPQTTPHPTDANEVTSSLPPTAAATTTTETQTTPSATHANETSSEAHSRKNNDSGLSAGSLAGITLVAVIAAVVVIGVVTVCLLRRRAQAGGQADHWTLKLFDRGKERPPHFPRLPRAVNNYSFTTSNHQIQESSPSGANLGGSLSLYSSAQDDDDSYELSAIPQSVDTRTEAATASGAGANPQDEADDEYNVLAISGGAKPAKPCGPSPRHPTAQDNYHRIQARPDQGTTAVPQREVEYYNVSGPQTAASSSPSPSPPPLPHNVYNNLKGLLDEGLAGSPAAPSSQVPEDNYHRIKARPDQGTTAVPQREVEYYNDSGPQTAASSSPSPSPPPPPLPHNVYNNLKGLLDEGLAGSPAAPSSQVPQDTYSHHNDRHGDGLVDSQQEGYYNISRTSAGMTRHSLQQDPTRHGQDLSHDQENDQSVYSVAQNLDASASAVTANATTISDYEIVFNDGDGGRGFKTSAAPHSDRSAAEDDAYNVIGEAVLARASEKDEEEAEDPAGHYDHLHNTSEEYSALGTDSRARDLQRVLAADEYSHIW